MLSQVRGKKKQLLGEKNMDIIAWHWNYWAAGINEVFKKKLKITSEEDHIYILHIHFYMKYPYFLTLCLDLFEGYL